MGVYQNGFKRPTTYKVIVSDEYNVVTEYVYSVLVAFTNYNSITEQQYLLLPTTMAKQRMVDFINFIHTIHYSDVVVDFNTSTLTPFDVQDEITCPITIPEPSLPPSIDQQTVNLSSEIISQTTFKATVRWTASISGGTALQNIAVPVMITNNYNNNIFYQTIIIAVNTVSGYIDIEYDIYPISYIVDCDINTTNTYINFILGIFHTEEIIPAGLVDPIIHEYEEEFILGGLKSTITITGSSNTNYRIFIRANNVVVQATAYSVKYELYNGNETILIQSGSWMGFGDLIEVPFLTNSSGIFTFVFYNKPDTLPDPYVDNCAEIEFVLFRSDNVTLNYSEHEYNYGCASYSPTPP